MARSETKRTILAYLFFGGGGGGGGGLLTGPFPLLLGGGFCSFAMGCSSGSTSWNEPNASRVSGVFLIVYSIIHHHNRNHGTDAPPTRKPPRRSGIISD